MPTSAAALGARESVLRHVLAEARVLGLAKSVALLARDLKAVREAKDGREQPDARRLPMIGPFPRAREQAEDGY